MHQRRKHRGLAAHKPRSGGVCVTRLASSYGRLPFVPQPFPGEILSSWLSRIAAEYGVSLEHLTRHLGLSAATRTEIDHASTSDDIQRAAAALSVTAAEIREMVHRPLKTPVRRLRERYSPVQVCTRCRADHLRRTNKPVAIKAWFEYWQIECQQCALPFSAPGGPNLNRSNPAREEPEWFGQIMPLARRGAAQIKAFARMPYSASVSPVAILRLLSMRRGHSILAKPEGTWETPRYADGDHCIAEFFLPGLRELLHQDSLLPKLWTEQRPVRLVSARTILYAAMANFLAEPGASYSRTVDALVGSRRTAVEQWLRHLPQHSAKILNPQRAHHRGNSLVSHLQQI
jgi:hypothetical protein